MFAHEKLSDILAPTFAEIEKEYFGGAVDWADRVHDGAWSKACLQFEDTITKAALEPEYYFDRVTEGAKIYKTELLFLIAKFKQSQNNKQLTTFFSDLLVRGENCKS